MVVRPGGCRQEGGGFVADGVVRGGRRAWCLWERGWRLWGWADCRVRDGGAAALVAGEACFVAVF